MKDKIVITAPLPPPIHGMSLATKMLIDGMVERELVVIDTAMDKSILAHSQPSIFSPKRLSKILYKLITHTFKMFFTPYSVHYMCIGMDYRGIVKYFPYALISILKRKPYYIHVHNSAFSRVYNALTGRKKQIIHYMFSHAAGIITLSESLRGMFAEVVVPDKIFVVGNCVDNNYFATENQIEEKQTRSRNMIKILYLSNLMEEKGILDLMEAVTSIDNCELHIGGAIENNETTQNRVKELLDKHKDRFFYYGIVIGEAKKRLLSECDIFVLPSRDEGQPISILEAYANGLAVVTDQNCGGIKDIFQDQVNGYSCTPTDPQSIKKAIENSFNSLDKFITPNYNYAKTKFTRAQYIKRLNEVFFSGYS